MKTMSIILLLSLILLNGACHGDKGQKPEIKSNEVAEVMEWENFDTLTKNKIDRFFLHRFHNHRFNGNVLFRKGKEVFKNFYGYRSFDEKDTLNINDRFQLASVSKPITATAILQLTEQGLLGLDDTVDQYLKDFNYPGITVRMLLTHQSGLPNYAYITDDDFENHEMSMSSDSAYRLLICDHPDRYYTPGKKYNYCNTNYFLLARIVEKVSGEKFYDYLQNRVFKPAGMGHTIVHHKGGYKNLPDVALGANVYEVEKTEYYLNTVYGDKGIFSTVGDLMKFDLALRKGILLKPETLQLAYTEAIHHSAGKPGYGLGWRISGDVVYHTGWWRGYRSYFYRDLKKDICIIVLSNSTMGGYLQADELFELLN
jgi:CubicO group peptidase (beta-lactamase class C family)